MKGFERPLIEETRASILLSLKSTSQPAYYKLLIVLTTPSKSLSYLNVGISYGNHIAQDDYENHIAQDDDLFMPFGEEPKELEELNDN